VEGIVGGDKTFLVAVGERLLPDAVQFPEILDLFRLGRAGRQPGRFGFEQGANGQQLVGFGVGGHVNESAECGP
jgi:hypothetical protein